MNTQRECVKESRLPPRNDRWGTWEACMEHTDSPEKLTWKDIHLLQIQEIERHKWRYDQKEGRDTGQEAVLDWIENYAAAFRAYWEKRLSKSDDD